MELHIVSDYTTFYWAF